MADIQMPQLGETVTEGTITKWFKQVGDEVAEDEPLFEVSTDKVDSEVPSPVAGYLTEILVHEGDTVDVGTVLAVISTPGGAADGGRRRAEAAEPEAEAAGRAGGRARPSKRSPRRRAGADRGPGRRRGPEPRSRAAAEGPSRPRPEARRRRRGPRRRRTATVGLLSPVVRRLIAEHGLDPTSIEGTGAGGRITRSDVLAPSSAGGPRRPPRRAGAPAPPPAGPPAAAPALPPAPPQPAGPVPGPSRWAATGDTVEPLNNIRRAPASTWCGRRPPRPTSHRHRGRLRGRRAGCAGATAEGSRRRRASASPTCRSSPGR